MIRRATPNDISAVTELGIEALNKDPYKGLIVDKEKVKKTAVEAISSSCNFCWVSEIDGEVVAAVTAIVHPCMFHMKQQASVVQSYTRVPGEAIKLLRELKRWWLSRPGIRMIVFSFDAGVDERLYKIFNRLGFAMSLPTMMSVK